MKAFKTRRLLKKSPSHVFDAFKDPAKLALWWGPDGFTNEFHRCEFSPNGVWSFFMIGPDGKRYANENRFIDIIEPSRVTIRHESEPYFTLRVDIAAAPEGAVIDWHQAFDSEDVANAIEHIVVPANEQNLNRLERLLEQDKIN